MKSLFLIAAALASLVPVPASATTGLGNVDKIGYNSGVNVPITGHFVDTQTFTNSLMGADLVLSMTIADTSKTFTPTDFAVYSGTVGHGTFIGDDTGFLHRGAWNFSVYADSLVLGSYYVELTGTVSTGALTASYSLDTTGVTAPPATSVPELSIWAMMGFGFAGLGYAGSRARKSVAIVA